MRLQERPVLFIAVSILVGVSACEGVAPASAFRSQVRDSAGVRWVVNHESGRADTVTWNVSNEPMLRIGAVDGDIAYLFGGIRGATRLSDGTVVVLDGISHELRAYSPTGSHVWTAGGRGAGPGEFQAPLSLQSLAGDVLQIEDGGHDRPLSRIRYSAAGELIEHTPIDWNLLQQSGSYTLDCRRVPRFVDDALILPEASCNIDVAERVMQSGPRRIVTTLARLRWPQAIAERLGSFATETVWVHSFRGGPLVFSLPMSPRGLFATGGDPARLAFASTNRYRIDVYDVAEARHLLRIDRPGQERPPTAEEADQAWVRWDQEVERTARTVDLIHGSGRALVDELARARRSIPVPDSISPIEGLVIDRLDHVWVQHRTIEPSEMQTWAVYGEDGMLLTDIMLPVGIRIVEIGEDYVLGITRDEYDVEYVTMLGLDRADQ